MIKDFKRFQEKAGKELAELADASVSEGMP